MQKRNMRIRIGFFLDGGETTGGINEYLKTVLSHLDKSRFTAVGIYIGPGDAVKDLGDYFEEKVILSNRRLVNFQNSRSRAKRLIVNSKKIWLIIATVFRLSRVIRRHRIDVIDVNYYPLHLIAGVASLFNRKPCVWHWHLAKRRVGFSKRLLRFSCSRFSSIIISCTQFTEDSLPLTKSTNHIVLYNPVDIDSILSKQEPGFLRTKLGLDKDVPLIAILGTISTIKGHRNFIEAANIILQRGFVAHFVVIGQETEAHRVRFDMTTKLKERICELGLSSNVHFLGEIPQASRYLSGCSILCMPTIPIGDILGESQGTAALEAMSLSVPVVVHSVGGYNELIEHGKTGLVVDCTVPENIADSIIELLDNPGLCSFIGENAQKFISSNLPVSTGIGRLQDVYTQLI
jgi:glycosyltransferase involved in cell wall biosynthesis